MLPSHTHFRIYCERTSDSLFAEPLNVLSNIGFLLAAWFLWQFYRENAKKLGNMPEVSVLIVLTVAIGLGSMIFHTFSTMGTVFFDIIPIFVFVFFYLYIFCRTLLDLGKGASGLLMALLVTINFLYKLYVPHAFDGYVSYLPTFMFLLCLALYMLLTRHPSSLRVVFAALVAFIALAFRSVDRMLCQDFPTGTHFIWHLLNALLIYTLVQEIMLYKLEDRGSSVGTRRNRRQRPL